MPRDATRPPDRRPPASNPANDRWPDSDPAPVQTAAVSCLFRVKTLEQLAAANEATRAVEFARRHAFAGKNPFGAWHHFVSNEPVTVVISLKQADGLFHGSPFVNAV